MSTPTNDSNSGVTTSQNRQNKTPNQKSTAPNKGGTTTSNKSALLVNGTPELEGCVFDYGGPLQAYQHAKKIDTIGNYCGKEHGIAMRLLVHGQESPRWNQQHQLLAQSCAHTEFHCTETVIRTEYSLFY